jgi:hypothetical protein
VTTNRHLLATIVAFAALGACGGGGDTPNPVEPPPPILTGTATLAIATAPEGLGAIRLRIFGSGMSNLRVRGSANILAQQTVADTTTYLLSLKNTAGTFFDISLSNKNNAPSVLVQEATAGALDGYRALAASSVVVSTTIQ